MQAMHALTHTTQTISSPCPQASPEFPAFQCCMLKSSLGTRLNHTSICIAQRAAHFVHACVCEYVSMCVRVCVCVCVCTCVYVCVTKCVSDNIACFELTQVNFHNPSLKLLGILQREPLHSLFLSVKKLWTPVIYM